MNLFRKRDKQKIGPGTDDGFNGPGEPADQHYLAYGSPSGPEFSSSDAARPSSSSAPFFSSGGGGSSSSLRSRNFKGLKGFGGLGGGSGSGSGGGSASPGGYNNASSRRRNTTGPAATSSATGASARALLKLPDVALARIFAFVCLHSQDRTYEKCEDSNTDDACMLCDMRDLAHCVQVCRRWRPVAEQVLYTSIRIDSVHYCVREAILSEKRKRRSFFDRNGEPEDTADARLKLLCRTLRDDPTQRLGQVVQFLKIPYMLRESRHADIARTVSVLPNLRYVDLPEGLFMDEPIYVTLKLEIQAKCPNLRKMTYMGGSERSLEALASGNLWHNLEVLELVKIGMDPAMLRHVLSSLPNLRALKVIEAAAGPHAFPDEVLAAPSSGPPFAPRISSGGQNGFYSDMPPLEELVLTDTRRLTSEGLLEYLSSPEARRALKVLTINGTGVKPWSLQAILALAPALRHLTIVDEVSVSLPIAAGTKDIQPLISSSLRTLNYEIRAANGVSPYAGVTRSYYNYLSGSILSGGLPNLRAVYVRDAQFPESLLGALPPPGPIGGAAFGEFGGSRRPVSSSSATATTSTLNSPMSTGSLGPVRSPMGFLSPHHSPGFTQASVPPVPPMPPLHHTSQWQSSSQNPFLDQQSPSFKSPFSSSPPVSLGQSTKPWVAGHNPRFSRNNPFAGMISPQKVQTLEVFTKGDDDIDWSSIVVSGGDSDLAGAGGSTSRPVSSYGLGADLGAVGARKSVLVNMGTGNFLAVPDAAGGGGSGGSGSSSSGGRRGSHGNSNGYGPELWPRPKSSQGEKKSEKRDLWR